MNGHSITLPDPLAPPFLRITTILALGALLLLHNMTCVSAHCAHNSQQVSLPDALGGGSLMFKAPSDILADALCELSLEKASQVTHATAHITVTTSIRRL